jgi:hypothetical protein
MEIRPVDPRDASWEEEQPTYRVYFWEADGASSEHELVGATDVTEVLGWADENRGTRTYTAYLVGRDGGGQLGLARLHGADPTRGS